MIKRLVLAVILMLVFAVPVLAQEDTSLKALDFLATVQNEDGGFSNGFSPESNLITTAAVVTAAAAAGEDPAAFFEADPLAYLEVQVGAPEVTPGQLAQIITAVVAAGADPTNFAEIDLVEKLLPLADAESSLIGTGAFDHCSAVIALQNVGAELPDDVITVVMDTQLENGGWEFMTGQKADTNTTALCVQALALTGETDSIEAGLAYLGEIQNEDGGWPFQSPSDFGTDSDVNSTALVIQALVATGEDLAEWGDPQAWLLSMQRESGAFNYTAAMQGDNIPATVAAIPAVVGVPMNAWAAEME